MSHTSTDWKMSSPAASQQMHAPSEQAAVRVFSNALGLSLSPEQLNSGGLFRAVGGLCKYALQTWLPRLCAWLNSSCHEVHLRYLGDVGSWAAHSAHVFSTRL